MIALLVEGGVYLPSWVAVALTVFSGKFARFTGKRRQRLRCRATPGFPVNQRVLREITGSEHDRWKQARARWPALGYRCGEG